VVFSPLDGFVKQLIRDRPGIGPETPT
jgi:hypothetical protein